MSEKKAKGSQPKEVMTLLEDEEWGGWRNRKIASRCGVSGSGHWMEKIQEIRGSLSCSGQSKEDNQPRTYTDQHGNVSTMNTENIGRKNGPPPPRWNEGAGLEEVTFGREGDFRRSPQSPGFYVIALGSDSPWYLGSPTQRITTVLAALPPASSK